MQIGKGFKEEFIEIIGARKTTRNENRVKAL